MLISKGLVEVRPKVGVRIRPRGDWNLFDPDVLAWQSEVVVDEEFVRTLCEVRLIVETSAAALAATRAIPEERDFMLPRGNPWAIGWANAAVVRGSGGTYDRWIQRSVAAPPSRSDTAAALPP